MTEQMTIEAAALEWAEAHDEHWFQTKGKGDMKRLVHARMRLLELARKLIGDGQSPTRS